MVKSAQSSKGRIEKKVLINASPSVIFRALTDGKDLVRWFCDRASSDPREGGELTAHWRIGEAGQKGRAIFRKFLPDSFLELIWVDDGDGVTRENPGHTVSYAIRTKRGSSEVVMTDEDDRELAEETYAFLDQGWNSVLLELKDYCERKERSSKPRPGETAE